jgi:hypothetical protein
MKLFMMLLLVLVSAMLTLALCPSLRQEAEAALIKAEIIPAPRAAPKSDDRLPAPGEVTLRSVWSGAEERAARAVGKDPESPAPGGEQKAAAGGVQPAA